MADYYSILSRALQAPEAANEKWRRRVYERARRALMNQLRAQNPPLPKSEIAAHQSGLDAAIERIESEYSRDDRGDVAFQDQSGPDQQSDLPAAPLIAWDGGRLHGASIWSNPISWVGVALVVAAIGAGGYTVWTTRGHAPAPQANNGDAKTSDAKTSDAKTSTTAPRASGTASGPVAAPTDLAPGIDGGSTDADLPYYFRRQPVFYRTTNPVGSIVIDKGQRYLYLIQVNNTALRYGIGVGAQCADLAGLRKISRKSEWPQWQPPQDMIDRRLAKPGTMAGGPGNPLGARVLDLDDDISRIHGTNAPKTIGTSVAFGCIRLVNDDIEDLYNRVPNGTRVVVTF